MNKFIRTVFILAMAVLFSTPATAASEDDPLVLLIQAKGKVMYSADGNRWKNVRRNKFLYEGNRVKTGGDGACKLISQETGMIERIGGNTAVEIRAEGTKALKGMISEAEHAGSLTGFLKRRFAKVQKYTAIQRRARSGDQTELETVRDITLSEDYPDLVWENVGPEYAYQLIVGEKVFDVPDSREAMVRFRLSRMEPGQYDYSVQVLYDGEILYAPENKGRLRWLSDAERRSLRERESSVRQVDPDNGFLLGSFMDKQGLKVTAMDQYRKFLTENPDANEVRPFLIKVFDDLKLEGLREAEAILYKQKLGNR